MAGKHGRPTKYNKERNQFFIDHLAKGYSKEATCGLAGIHADTMYEWIKRHPSFSDAIKKGEALSIAYFEKLLLAKTSGQKINGFNAKDSDTACLIFALKTRFHRIYGNKLDINADVNINSITELVKNHT